MGNLINLTKTAKVVLEKKKIANVQAEVVVAVDISGSMSGRFSNGTVQEVLERLLSIGMNIDVNKSIDVFAFNTNSKYVGEVNEGNHQNYVNDVFKKKAPVSGGTKYSPVMNEIINKYGFPITKEQTKSKGLFGKMFGKDEKTATISNTPQKYPTFVFFITDGDNNDKPETIEVIKEAAKQGIFWQFVGIGGHDSDFPFLQKLDDLTGRFVDNADFFSVNDILKKSDEELYNLLLTEFPGWLNEVKSKGLIV